MASLSGIVGDNYGKSKRDWQFFVDNNQHILVRDNLPKQYSVYIVNDNYFLVKGTKHLGVVSLEVEHFLYCENLERDW